MILISNSSRTTFQNPVTHQCRDDRSAEERREVLEGFSTKLKVEYDDQDLKGLMETAQHEKLSSSQVPEIVVEQTRKDNEGNEEKEQVFSKFIFSDLYYYLFCKE